MEKSIIRELYKEHGDKNDGLVHMLVGVISAKLDNKDMSDKKKISEIKAEVNEYEKIRDETLEELRKECNSTLK